MLDPHVSRSSTILFDPDLPSEPREDGRKPLCPFEGQNTGGKSTATSTIYHETQSLKYKISLPEAAKLLLSPDRQRMNFNIHDVDLEALRIADINPPVTIETLGGLDIVTILNNAQLRHDLNYDTDILFYPGRINVTPEDRARDAAYWSALAFELALYMSLPNSSNFSSAATSSTTCTEPSSTNTGNDTQPYTSIALLALLEHNSIPARLPSLFHAMRGLLKTLIRADDWLLVDHNLDVDFIMQQLRRGSCDLYKLIEWLGDIMTKSCSPVRDVEVERATDQIKGALQERDPEALVAGLKGLFGVLEVMKLVSQGHSAFLYSTAFEFPICVV